MRARRRTCHTTFIPPTLQVCPGQGPKVLLGDRLEPASAERLRQPHESQNHIMHINMAKKRVFHGHRDKTRAVAGTYGKDGKWRPITDTAHISKIEGERTPRVICPKDGIAIAMEPMVHHDAIKPIQHRSHVVKDGIQKRTRKARAL